MFPFYHCRLHISYYYSFFRRVKARDLLTIANHHRKSKGKELLKSFTTVWNRSRPRNIRSIQAKQHKGKSLFCTSKPPKAEDMDNECTHYQRAHVKNVQMYLFQDKLNSDNSLLHSMDDKAYVRPGTSEGCEKTRRVRILNLSDEGAKQLPKYDWPQQMVYQTTSAHRIMTKSPVVIDGQTKMVTDSDNHFVIVRPKAIVDSSGTTWASEIARLRIMSPDVFEIPSDKQTSQCSKEDRSFAAYIYYATFLYMDMTEEEDLKKVTSNSDSPHRIYEKKRVCHLLNELQAATDIQPNGYVCSLIMILNHICIMTLKHI